MAAGHPLLGVVDVSLDKVYFACIGPLALLGDLFCSMVKRAFGIKDSCDCASEKYTFYKKIKSFLGDHGGCLDRIDSVIFSGTILLILDWIYILWQTFL